MDREHRMKRVLAAGFVAMGVLARLVPHPWNVTPLTAIALFAGAHLPKRASLLLLLGIVALSDWLLGWHATMPFTWGALGLTALLGWRLRTRLSARRILLGSLGGSIGFFLITNFGVWWVGGLYPSTMEGLWQCYAAAVPFFRNMLAGDLVYTAAFFGGYALATRSPLMRLAASPMPPTRTR